MLARPPVVGSRLAPVSYRCRAVLPIRAAAATQAATRVRYSKPPKNADPYYYLVAPPKDVSKITNVEPDEVHVDVNDLRSSTVQWHRNGFELVDLPGEQAICWDEADQVEKVFYPQIEAMLKKVTGAHKVHIMSHGLRRGKTPKSRMEEIPFVPLDQVSLMTHVDFSESSGPAALKEHMKEEATELSKKPWAIIQVWKPIVGPVQDSPLGLIDTTTMSTEDTFTCPVHISGGGVHEVNMIAHNPKHQWYYTSQMQTDEAYIFVNYDSRDDGRARFTPHASIVDSSVPEDVPKRESVEARALVFWD